MQIRQPAEYNDAPAAGAIFESDRRRGLRSLLRGRERSDMRIGDGSRQEKLFRDTESEIDNGLTYSLSVLLCGRKWCIRLQCFFLLFIRFYFYVVL